MNKKKGNKYNILLIIVIVLIIITLFWLLFKKEKKEIYRIDLLGNRYIVLSQDEEYVEPGFTAYLNDEVVTNKVVVTNEVKNNPGVYRVLYQIGNIYEYRYVEIKEKLDPNIEITLVPSSISITNKSVFIDVTVTGDTFSSLTLPNGEVVYNKLAKYEVLENGTYKFEARNSDNEVFSKEIVIDNIDTSAPTGTCVATLNNSNTNIKVSSEDNITYYYYDNNSILITSEDNNYITSNKTSEIIKVILEDRAGNTSEIKCQIIDNRYYEQVIPRSGENVVYHGDTDTLKTYIVNGGSYYLTYIWVKNPYMQLNKFDSPEYGKNLYTPRSLLEKAKSTYNLNNKMIIGFNASGFYLKDTFDAYSVDAYPAYNKTSVGSLVITNGKVVRNAYDHSVKTWYTIGVNKDNKLLVFEDKQSGNHNDKLAWSQSVIASGIRNTFTFSAPLLENGVRTNITTSMPGGFTDSKGLQIIGQINDNNFLLFTSRNETRNKAINLFLERGCQTAMNLDGGGSIALLYKEKTSNEFTTVIGGGRALPEVGYFTE